MRTRFLSCLGAACALLALALPASASFHLMQIEKIIGGVNGNTTAQAIQLRMRSLGQNFVFQGRLVAWDANGANPVTILVFPGSVANSAAGSRVLIASANFVSQTSPTTVPDFTMTNLIPASYLAAGKLTFETNSGAPGSLVWWAVAWGGAAYMGSNTGFSIGAGGNDDDGNFNPPFGLALPSTTLQNLGYTGAVAAGSTNNAAQYVVSAGAAMFNNNTGTSFTVVGAPMGACCPNAGTGCTLTTSAGCVGGTWLAGTTCSPSPCTGVCCATDLTCSITSQSQCASGFWTQNGTCSPNPCLASLGACCPAAGGCNVTTQGGCTGAFMVGTTCSPSPCAPTGACCNGITCSTGTTQVNCLASGGEYLGDSTTCSPNNCAGACCHSTPLDPTHAVRCDAPVSLATCNGYAVHSFVANGSCIIVAGPPHTFCCPGNFNQDDIKNVADIFFMLTAWFQHSASADWDGSNILEVGDIFQFLATWFAPC